MNYLLITQFELSVVFIHIKPSRFNLLLHDETASAQQATNSYLVRPKDATLLYENKHFGNQPLEIYELVPPRSGFSCLGKCFKCSLQSLQSLLSVT